MAYNRHDPEVLRRVWDLYQRGKLDIEIANALDLWISTIPGLIEAARATVGVEDLLVRYGVRKKADGK